MIWNICKDEAFLTRNDKPATAKIIQPGSYIVTFDAPEEASGVRKERAGQGGTRRCGRS